MPTSHRGYIIRPHFGPGPCWYFQHKDFDGDGDQRFGYGETWAECAGQIDAAIRSDALDELGVLDADLIGTDTTCDCGAVTNNAAPICGSCLAEYRAESADAMGDF